MSGVFNGLYVRSNNLNLDLKQVLLFSIEKILILSRQYIRFLHKISNKIVTKLFHF